MVFVPLLLPYFSFHVTHPDCVCVCLAIQGALTASFIFPTPSPICFQTFVPSSLSLIALDWLRASVSIPKQLRDAAVNKEDYCLSSLKRGTAISGGVSLNDSPHIELLVQGWRPFIPHPRGEGQSAAEGCRVSRAWERPGTKSIARSSGTIVDCELQFLTLSFWNAANVSPCLLPVLDWYLLRLDVFINPSTLPGRHKN